MADDAQDRFDAGAKAWRQYNQKPLGWIRQQVTWQNLSRHLPPVKESEPPPRVLDVGGGTGELALELASNGYEVVLLDFAPSMLEQARVAANGLPKEVRNRLSYWPISVEMAPKSFPVGAFDVIACHTLIEYLPRPQESLYGLVALLRKGGLISLSFVNRHAEVLRRVWRHGDPWGALSGLEAGGFVAGLFKVSGNAFDIKQISAWLAELGMTVLGEYGVRVFADFVSGAKLDDPTYFDALLRLELAAAEVAPYNHIARYGQVVASKSGNSRVGPT